MELAPIAYESAGLGLPRTIQEREKQEAERESAALARGDSVSISDEARQKLKIATAGETADAEEKEDPQTGGDLTSDWQKAVQAKRQQEKGTSGEIHFQDMSGGGPEQRAKASDEQIAAVQKQIRDVQQQLAKAQQAAQAAEAGQEAASAQGDPDASAQTEASPELQAAKAKVAQYTTKLLQLNQQLQKLQSDDGVDSGGGMIQGTRAGSGGGMRKLAHIGESKDPYAAAAAAEATEMGLDKPTSF